MSASLARDVKADLAAERETQPKARAPRRRKPAAAAVSAPEPEPAPVEPEPTNAPQKPAQGFVCAFPDCVHH